MKKITIMTMAVCLCASTAIFAADGSWINTAGGDWEVAGNWASNIIADGADSTANFTQNGDISVDSYRTVGVFRTDCTQSFRVNDGPLVLDATTPVIDVFGAGFLYLNCALAGSSGYNKTGSGVLYLYDTTISGDINVNAGQLELMHSNSIVNADVNVTNATLLLLDGVVANGKSVTVNTGGVIQPKSGTVGLNAPLTCARFDAGDTFAVQVPNANDVINLNGNITLTKSTVMTVDGNASTININAPISGGNHDLRLLGRSTTADVGIFNINAPCTYEGQTTLQSSGANPRYEIGVNQAFPCGGATTEFSLEVVNDFTNTSTSVTLDLNDYTQKVSTLWLKPDGSYPGCHVEITGSDKALLIVTNGLHISANGSGAHAKITGGKVVVSATAGKTFIRDLIIVSNATLILNTPWESGMNDVIVEVQKDGIVGGTSYASLNVKNGGKISPGDGSIGTLEATGDITMESGSEYDWEINGDSADFIYVSGGTLDISAGGIIVNVINAGSPNGGSKTLFLANTINGIGTDITMNYGPGVAGPANPIINGANITATVTPEPGIIGLLSLLGLAILRRK